MVEGTDIMVVRELCGDGRVVQVYDGDGRSFVFKRGAAPYFQF